MPDKRCTARIRNPKSGQETRCNNPGVVAVVDPMGTREVYCLGHKALYEGFLAQAQHDAARWRNVPQYAEGASA